MVQGLGESRGALAAGAWEIRSVIVKSLRKNKRRGGWEDH